MKMTHEERRKDGRFIKLENGKTGGFKKGIPNGPEPTTKRGKARRTK